MWQQQQHKRHLQEGEEEETGKQPQLQQTERYAAGGCLRTNASGTVSHASEENDDAYEDKEEDLYSEEYAFDDDSDGGDALRVADALTTAESRKTAPAEYRSLTPAGLSEALLRVYRWRSEDLLQEWFHDKAAVLLQEWFDDKAAVLKKARLPHPAPSETDSVTGDEESGSSGTRQIPSSAAETSPTNQHEKPAKRKPTHLRQGYGQSVGNDHRATNAAAAADTSQQASSTVEQRSAAEAGETAGGAATTKATSSSSASRASCSSSGSGERSARTDTPGTAQSSASFSSKEASRAATSPSDMFECPITTLVVPYCETSALPCGHRFANECVAEVLLR
eukprot:XP_028343930.1 uncharacterized protein LOC112062756 [Physeter catodon]